MHGVFVSASETVSFGYEQVSPEEKTRRVGSVFSSVASKYDIMNDAMSGGTHRLWKNLFIRRIRPRAGEHFLDMAGGTGDIAFRLAAKGAQVMVSDINADMLAVGKERADKLGIAGLDWSVQNAETLSFDDSSFDGYTIALGIRNVTHIDRGLAEAHRVLKPGGRFYCLEFSTVEWPGFRDVYDAYSHNILPRLGQLIAGDADSYRYLVESIRKFPPMPQFKAMISDAGFRHTKVEPILGGLVAIHSGWKI
jgi:demethylmenaquinone methyltransferase / 2-methoxy-6-polyprenyl-1,4-benzoquinol methylase